MTIRPTKENERPLFLSLLWGTAHSGHGFRLRDQMEAEPVWCEFKENELEGKIDKNIFHHHAVGIRIFHHSSLIVQHWLVSRTFLIENF